MTRTIPACRLLAAAATLLGAPTANGQAVQGTVVNQETGSPVSRGLVALVDPEGRRRHQTLTDTAGRFSLGAESPGLFRVRIERIGFVSWTSEPLALRRGEVARLDARMPAVPVRLEALVIEERPRCRVHPLEGGQTATVWEEARKALATTSLIEGEGLLHVQVRTFDRDLDRRLRMLREKTETRDGVTATPFVSAPAVVLATQGYVQSVDDSTTWWYGPDADVLFSAEFLDTHCFTLERGTKENHGLIGLAFEPIAGRTMPDITGVMWLDVRNAELRFVEYRYTNIEMGVSLDQLGGRIDFDRLESGEWIVRDWWLRMPRVAMHRSRRRLIGYRVQGGTVTRAVPAGGRR